MVKKYYWENDNPSLKERLQEKIKNLVFLIKREVKFFYQRRVRGFDDSELWNLDFTISKFVLPRLKAFKKITHGYPNGLTEQEWDIKLDQMIATFEFLVKESEDSSFDIKKHEEAKKGLQLFGEYFQSLWD